jgi:hypothetical protein
LGKTFSRTKTKTRDSFFERSVQCPLSNSEVLKMKKLFTPEAEILNARLAMIGFVAAVGAYFTTGQIIPGVW